ncbi:MAG: hypothetical protein AAFZ07_20300 [Actinomycetota bacterium]
MKVAISEPLARVLVTKIGEVNECPDKLDTVWLAVRTGAKSDHSGTPEDVWQEFLRLAECDPPMARAIVDVAVLGIMLFREHRARPETGGAA